MVKRHAQLAGQIAESTMSSVGKVVDEVRTARMEVAAAVAQAESTKETL